MIIIKQIFSDPKTINCIVKEAKKTKKVMDKLARMVSMHGAISDTIEFRGHLL